MNEKIKQEITLLAKSLGVGDVGFCKDQTAHPTLCNLISIVVPLSKAVVEEIDNAPTHSYFHHYRTVNAFIDSTLLRIGRLLEEKGYLYIPIPASQSVNINGCEYNGRYSHKKAARLSGMGVIGKNSLFIHKDFGPAVRLGTLFTNCDFGENPPLSENFCKNCDACVKACPSMAIKGGEYKEGVLRHEIFDPKACSDYMKSAFSHIGRGAVCGICMKACINSHNIRKIDK